MKSLWTLYTLTLRQQLHGKRWIVLSLLFLLPAALALTVEQSRTKIPPVALEFVFAFMFIPQAVLPLAALIEASGIIQDELEEQTITYLLIRPIPRWTLYVVKLLGAMTTTIAMMAIFTSVTYAVIYGFHSDADPTRRCALAIGIHGLAVICYCCIFGLLGLLTKRILIGGIMYIVVVEGLLANLAFGIRLVTVIYYARLIAYRVLPFNLTTPAGTENLSADAWQLDLINDPQLLEHPTLQTCLMVLIAASLILVTVGAVICSGREFHVKTPEKN
jgi:ABC-2 type transport system permease protein